MSPHRWFIGFICLTWIWPGCANSAFAQTTERRDPKERAIDYRLRQPISLNMKDVPLRQAIRDLSVASGVQIVTDELALAEARIDMESPLSMRVEEIEMRFALNIMLRPLGLGYIVEDDVLKITTKTRAWGKPVAKKYPVADLIVPGPAIEGQKVVGHTRETNLMKFITEIFGGDSWVGKGGPGTLEYSVDDKSLIIRQQIDVHEEIRRCLATLRELKDLRVNVEVRFVHATPDGAQQWQKIMAEAEETVFAFQPENSENSIYLAGRMGGFIVVDTERIGTYLVGRMGAFIMAKERTEFGKFLMPSMPGLTQARPFASVSDLQIQPLLKMASTHDRWSIVTAPNSNAYNGQKINFECFHKGADAKEKAIAIFTEEKNRCGWRCSVQPVVGPYRQLVRLTMNVEHFANDDSKSVEQIIRAAKTFFYVDDGRTLVWDLGETAQRQHLFVLVTPRVVVREAAPEAIVIEDAPATPER